MEKKTDRLYPSAALEKDYLEQRLEKKLKDVKSFDNHINNIKEMITFFQRQTPKIKKEV